MQECSGVEASTFEMRCEGGLLMGMQDKDSGLEPARYFDHGFFSATPSVQYGHSGSARNQACVGRDPGIIIEDSSLHSNGFFVASKLRIKTETCPHRLSPDIAKSGRCSLPGCGE